MKSSETPRWLFKEEPSHYSFSDLQRDGATAWTGVRNPLALKNLRQVKLGDRVLYYHTGKERAIVGEMVITQAPAADDPSGKDPSAVSVEVQPIAPWPVPLGLERIKRDKELANWDLVRLPRLSVVPISAAQWKRLCQLRSEAEAAAPGQ
jgi:predicted RNA-binding protein with PUA-like domain